MVEELLLRQRPAFAQAKEFQHLVFFVRDMDALRVDLYRLMVEIDYKVARLDDRLRVAFGTTYDGMDARNQFVLVERFGHVIVGAETEPLDLVLNPREPGKD